MNSGLGSVIDASNWQTLRIIHLNMGWALIYNVIGLPIAALGMLNLFMPPLPWPCHLCSLQTPTHQIRIFKRGVDVSKPIYSSGLLSAQPLSIGQIFRSQFIHRITKRSSSVRPQIP